MEDSDKILLPTETGARIRDIAEISEKGICVVFGAGASFGYSNDSSVATPPIVAHLFDDDNPIVHEVINTKKHAFIKGQRAHITRRLGQFNNDLEAYLTDLYKKDINNNTFSYLLLYLQDIFAVASKFVDFNDNNYQSLINILADWRGTKPWSLLSFNYDTILEQSFLDRFIPKRQFSDKENYIGPYPKVLKIHGGVNFRYLVRKPFTDQPLTHHEVFTKMMGEVDCNEDILVPGSETPEIIKTVNWQGGLVREYNFPLMMVPIHGSIDPKNSFFKSQIELAKKEMSQADLVISIGYNFGDELFINALKTGGAGNNELILVGHDPLLEDTTNHVSYLNAKKVWHDDRIHIFGDSGFRKFIEALYL